MILSLLIAAICFAVLFQPTRERFVAGAAFAAFLVLHDLLLASADGFAYYGSAALVDLIIVALLHKIEPLPTMALALQRLCVVSIVTNFAGFLLWYNYSPPTAYNVAFLILNAWAVWILTRDVRDVGDPADYRGGAGLRGHPDSGFVLLPFVQGAPRC